MSENEIEQAIQAAGKTAARVTPQRIDDVIVGEYFFTADKATAGCPQFESLKLLTFCVLVLKNGFTVTGESACASPENFDEAIGRRIAKENARSKVWQLEGYLLRQTLHDAKA